MKQIALNEENSIRLVKIWNSGGLECEYSDEPIDSDGWCVMIYNCIEKKDEPFFYESASFSISCIRELSSTLKNNNWENSSVITQESPDWPSKLVCPVCLEKLHKSDDECLNIGSILCVHKDCSTSLAETLDKVFNYSDKFLESKF